jgi:hypothetical protein
MLSAIAKCSIESLDVRKASLALSSLATPNDLSWKSDNETDEIDETPVPPRLGPYYNLQKLTTAPPPPQLDILNIEAWSEGPREQSPEPASEDRRFTSGKVKGP